MKPDANLAQQIKELEGDEASLISCVRDGNLKAKLDQRSVNLYDAAGQKTTEPSSWKGRVVNVVLVAKGTWKTRSGCGICLEATDVQFLPGVEPSCPF